jgi:WD40 repeat protein
MTEETFVLELERRANDVHGAPLTVDDVRGRARVIQRRRRAAAAGAVAAVMAAAVLVPAALTGGGKSSAPDPAPEIPAVPGASVLHDGVVTRDDGSTLPVDVDNARNQVQSFVSLPDGRVVVGLSKPYSVRVYTADGSLEEQYGAQNSLVVSNATDSLVAWVGEDYSVQVLETGVAEPVTLPGISPGGEASGLPDVVLGTTCADGGCSVLAGDGTTTFMRSTVGEERTTRLRTSERLRVVDVSPDGQLWAVEYADDADPQFGCSGLYDPEAAELVARSCTTSLLRFSPDGQHLTGARGDGGMWGSVEVFDLDLVQVSTYDPGDDDVVKTWAWADSTHVLAVVAGLDDRPEWSLQRVPIDGGAADVVAGPVDGPSPDYPSEFLLSE